MRGGGAGSLHLCAHNCVVVKSFALFKLRMLCALVLFTGAHDLL